MLVEVYSVWELHQITNVRVEGTKALNNVKLKVLNSCFKWYTIVFNAALVLMVAYDLSKVKETVRVRYAALKNSPLLIYMSYSISV